MQTHRTVTNKNSKLIVIKCLDSLPNNLKTITCRKTIQNKLKQWVISKRT